MILILLLESMYINIYIYIYLVYSFVYYKHTFIYTNVIHTTYIYSDVNNQLSKITHNYERFDGLLQDNSINTTTNISFKDLKRGM